MCRINELPSNWQKPRFGIHLNAVPIGSFFFSFFNQLRLLNPKRLANHWSGPQHTLARDRLHTLVEESGIDPCITR